MHWRLILLLTVIMLTGYYFHSYQSESNADIDQSFDLKKKSNKLSSNLTRKDLHEAFETILERREAESKRTPAQELDQNNPADDSGEIDSNEEGHKLVQNNTAGESSLNDPPDKEYELEFNMMNPSERQMTIRNLEEEIQANQAILEEIDKDQDKSHEERELEITRINQNIEDAKYKLEFFKIHIETYGLNHEEPETN